jgi:hypothetical protein
MSAKSDLRHLAWQAERAARVTESLRYQAMADTPVPSPGHLAREEYLRLVEDECRHAVRTCLDMVVGDGNTPSAETEIDWRDRTNWA